MGINAETDNRFDMLTNKNVKYLFYRYNDFLLSKNLSVISIRHGKFFFVYGNEHLHNKHKNNSMTIMGASNTKNVVNKRKN